MTPCTDATPSTPTAAARPSSRPRCRPRPERHIAYLGTDAATIAEEMVAEDDDWTAVTSVLEDDGRLVGWLMGSVDAEMGRVWWFGPFLDAPDEAWPALADSVYDDARTRLPESVRQEELAVDSRFTTLAVRWRDRARFPRRVPGPPCWMLDDDLDPPSVPVRPVRPQDAAALAPLHERLFAGTHLTGEVLVSGADAAHLRLVAERDGVVARLRGGRTPARRRGLHRLPRRRRAGQAGGPGQRAGARPGCTPCAGSAADASASPSAARTTPPGPSTRASASCRSGLIDPFRIGFSLG